ncbi:MAG: hypothetical protein LLF90_01460 [Methanomicrobiaceae archaeon]|uniref:hypothetical protein n=1 Tax=Methanoculleus sp. TaxID=90427 RepID=UPI00320DC993|nr:hypothetical protein [Methanomicrobiaceae archaeon]
MEKRWLTAALVILMLTVSVCPGFASAVLIADECGRDVEHGERTNSVELLKAGLNKREPVTIALGGLPLSKGGRNASYSDLENFTAATADLIREHYLYPNGPVIGFGYNVDGYLRVSLWNGPPPPENVSSMEAVYTMLDERAKGMGIENIPVKFTVFVSPPELVLDCDRMSPSDRTGSYAQSPENCPEKVTSLDALTVALRDPEVIGLLENTSIETITFSKGTYADRNMNYTQMVFRLKDPDPDDCMTAPMIVVQVNDSCGVSAAYETYPSYIPGCRGRAG